jgi:xanthine dehydrogenase YagR molybdenum-binding subunit
MTAAITRTDGPAKVTGTARYAADWPAGELTHAVLVTAAIPAGRIISIDTGAALAAPGVIAVFTHHNAPRLNQVTAGAYSQTVLPLQDDLVRYEGEPVTVVIAGRLEQAQEAAGLVRVEYALADFTADLDAAAHGARPPKPGAAGGRVMTSSTGDVAAGLAAADAVVDAAYQTAARHHSALEPSATLAEFRDGTLTLHDATQGLFWARDAIASALGLPAGNVRSIAQYIGGGFGSKGFCWPHQIIAAMTARAVERPVRLQLTRAQSFTGHGYHPATRQTVTLGATRDGQLTAIRHTSLNATSAYGPDHVEMAAGSSRSMYACPAIETSHRVAEIATILPTPMRAPDDGPGMFALESAMDELAAGLGLDPVELRLRNDTGTDPTSGKPFSSRELRACYHEGARRFGWQHHPVGSMREGNDLIGWGVASAHMQTFRFPASARVSADSSGRVLVETAAQEIGGGTRTVLPQIAASALGCPVGAVDLRMGDTRLPPAPVAGGSGQTLSTGSAVHAAARELLARLASMALAEGSAPADMASLDGADLVLRNGVRMSLHDLLGKANLTSVSAEGSWIPDGDEYSMHVWGAVFAEVRVDADLRLTRVGRLTGVYSAGRIINPLTAGSQMIGGMVWGIGEALLEQSVIDTILGRFLAKNLAGYLVPVNADVPRLDVAFVDETDLAASLIGGKGIGELGATGVSAAIANAVYNATGIRVRDIPITPEALM